MIKRNSSNLRQKLTSNSFLLIQHTLQRHLFGEGPRMGLWRFREGCKVALGRDTSPRPIYPQWSSRGPARSRRCVQSIAKT